VQTQAQAVTSLSLQPGALKDSRRPRTFLPRQVIEVDLLHGDQWMTRWAAQAAGKLKTMSSTEDQVFSFTTWLVNTPIFDIDRHRVTALSHTGLLNRSGNLDNHRKIAFYRFVYSGLPVLVSGEEILRERHLIH
jgi:hypothetical protein